MRPSRRFWKTAITIASVAALFLLFFNGYKAEGPSRGKFKKLGDGEVDLTSAPEAPEIDRLKEFAGNARVKKWAAWWQRCAPSFSPASMENIGLAAIYEEAIPFASLAETKDGPGSGFLVRSPDEKRELNPYYGRLLYRKEAGGWQPYIELPCGAALYDLKEKKARNVLNCSALEGIDDAFFADANRFLLLGYSAISRQMNVECETTKSCIAPTVWILDLGNGQMSEHRGPIMKRDACSAGDYLKIKFPNFFGK